MKTTTLTITVSQRRARRWLRALATCTPTPQYPLAGDRFCALAKAGRDKQLANNPKARERRGKKQQEEVLKALQAVRKTRREVLADVDIPR